MSAHNDNNLVNLAQQGYPGPVEISSGSSSSPSGPTTQATALPIIGQVVRVMFGVSNMALVLPDIQLGTSDTIVFVVNESANAVVVFPAVAGTGNPAQQMNGTNNASLSIPSGQTGIFSMINQTRVGKGGGVASPTNGWLGAVWP